MSIIFTIIICGSILSLGFFVLCGYMSKLERDLEILKLILKIKEKETKIKESTVFSWIFVLSVFAIIWIEEYRTQLIGTLIMSFLFAYLAIRGEENK